MLFSAPRSNILITNVASYLGSSLAQLFLEKNYAVFGVDKKSPKETLLIHKNFTLLEIDLSQPLPEHLPDFELIYCLLNEEDVNFSGTHLSPSMTNLLKIQQNGESEVVITLPIRSDPQLVENLTARNLNVFLVGDLYGPSMKLLNTHEIAHIEVLEESKEISNQITQAFTSDDVILDKEGTKAVYPTYIDDAIAAIYKLSTVRKNKKVRFIVSEDPVSSLSLSYEIQRTCRLSLGKELNLFFRGEETKTQAQPHVKVSPLGFDPKFPLPDGLKETFKSLAEEPKVAVKSAHPNSRTESESRLFFGENMSQRSTPRERNTRPAHKKIRRMFVVFVIIYLLFAFKTIYDIKSGVSLLKTSALNLESGDFRSSEDTSQKAKNRLQTASQELKITLLPVKLLSSFYNNQIESIQSLTAASNAINALSGGVIKTAENIKVSIDSKNKVNANYEDASNLLSQASLESQKTQELLKEASLFFTTDALSGLREKTQSLTKTANTALVISNLLPEVFLGDKRYIVTLVNENELRPGGGVIEAITKIEFSGGKLTKLQTQNARTFDIEPKVTLNPPVELSSQTQRSNFYLKDAFWNLDFEQSAQNLETIYKNQSDEKIDGVLAIDVLFLESLEKTLGVSTKDSNYQNRLSQAINALMEKTIQGYIKPVEFGKLLAEGIAKRNIQIAFVSSDLSRLSKVQDFNVALPPFDPYVENSDYLAVSQANLTQEPTSAKIIKSTIYEVNLNDQTSKLTLNFKNENQKDHTAHLKIYAPTDATLNSYKEANAEQIKKITVGSQNNLTVFSNTIIVPKNGSLTLTYDYTNTITEKLKDLKKYNLLVQKQPGTKNETIKYTILGGSKPTSVDATIDKDLAISIEL